VASHLLAFLLLLPMLAVAGDPVPFGQPFSLAVAETSIVGFQLEVAFVEILADSRCPADVLCVWEGDAAAKIMIRPIGRDPEIIDLHTHEAWGRERDLGAWRIMLLEVVPYPESATIPIDPATYVVTLQVDAIGPAAGVPTAWGAAKAGYR
jgi:hypothetical protein